LTNHFQQNSQNIPVNNFINTYNAYIVFINLAISRNFQSKTCLTISSHHPQQGIVGALAQLKLGAPRTPEQIAYEDMMRRQSWESGQIDFSGRDSFANIWARIEQTISTNPTAMAEEAPPAPAATPAPIVPVMQKTPEGN
jgi:hypothetical protein